MNKKKYGIIAAVAAVIVVLGVFFAVKANSAGKVNYEKDQYITAMNSGKDSVDDKNYRAAKKHFARAETYKKNDVKANAYKNQADNFIRANKSIDKFKFDDAIDYLDNVKSEPTGYSVMIKQANTLNDKLEKVLDNIDTDIEPLQDEAKAALANKDYAGAISAYDKILKLSYIKTKYYKKIYQETKAARTEAENLAREANSNGTPSDNSMNTEGATDKDKQLNGQEITPQMIADARSQMQALGTNPGPWSDFDIIKVIKIAAANGHSQITQADIDQFLG